MDEINLITIGLAGLIATLVIFGLLQFFSRTLARRWNKHKAETIDRWAADGVEFVRGPTAGQFGGLESMGINRVLRGIGYALLTPTDLRVTCATPTRSWIVTFRQIKGVTLEPNFMGKRAKKVPFIVVRFVKDGASDKLAFQVNDAGEWAEALAKAAKVRLVDKTG